MSRANFGAAIRELERLLGDGTVAGLTERQLLERFVDRRDESAFEALVRRHGPMVLGVCRRLLHDPYDVDDAFQATFLVLVRKAASIRDGDRLGPWLYGVAHRVARRVRVQGARRRERETGGEAMAAHEPARVTTSDDFGAELHEELARLPERYRAPIVLCDLGGCTHEEAARRLGWPLGTVKGRQSRARDLLRDRLARRGLTPTTAAITAALAADAHAALSPALVHSTVRAAMCLAAGGATTAAAGLASATAVGAAEQVSHAMIWIKLKLVATGLMSAGILAGGVGAYSLQEGGGAGPDTQQENVDAGANSTQKTEATPEQSQSPFATGFGSTSPAADTPEPATPEIANARKALAEARINIARQQFENQLAQLEEGTLFFMGGMGGGMGGGGMGGRGRSASESVIEPIYRSSLSIVRVQQEALGGDFDQKQAIAEHLERMERLREPVQNPDSVLRQQHGMLGDSPAMAGYYVAEAQLWQAEAEAGLEPGLPSEPGGVVVRDGVVTPGGSGAGLAPGGDLEPPRLDARTRGVLEALEQPVSMNFTIETPLEDIVKYIRSATQSESHPDGIPIYVDPLSLQAAEVTMQSPVSIDLDQIPLKTTLRLLLRQIRLNFIVKDGLVMIGCPDDVDFMEEAGANGGSGAVPGYGLVPPGGWPPPPVGVQADEPSNSGFGGGGFQ